MTPLTKKKERGTEQAIAIHKVELGISDYLRHVRINCSTVICLLLVLFQPFFPSRYCWVFFFHCELGVCRNFLRNSPYVNGRTLIVYGSRAHVRSYDRIDHAHVHDRILIKCQ